MAETRKDKRAPVSLRVRFKSASVDEFIEQFSHDISRGGIFIKTKTPMNIGTLLKFEFQLKDESRLIHGVGRVVWRRDDAGSTEDSPAGMGIKFIKMDADSRALVERIASERGDAPAAFEAGPAAAEKAEKQEEAPTSAPFFPETPPDASAPLPEDRTQVRHAAEFLSSALAASEVETVPPSPLPSEPPPEPFADRPSKSTMIGAAFALSPEARAQIETERNAREEREAAEKKAEEERAAAERAAEERRASEKAAAEKAAAEKAVEETRLAEEKKRAEERAAADRKKAEEEKSMPPQKNSSKQSDKKKGGKGQEKKGQEKKPQPVESKRPQPVESKRPQGRESVRPAVQEPRSNLPLVLGIVVVFALAYLAWKGLWSEDQPTTTEPQEITDTSGDTAESAGGNTVETPPEAPPAEAPPPVPPSEVPPVEEATPAPDAGSNEIAPAPPETVQPAPAMVAVRIESTPPGAQVTVAGSSRGTTPLSVELPADTDAAVELRLAGHAPFSQNVKPVAGRPSVVRARMVALPYEITVETTPAGARVTGARRTVTAPGALAVGRVAGPVTVTATLAGYQNATATVRPTDFVEENGAMRTRITLTLNPRPAAPPPAATPQQPATPRPPARPRPPAEQPGETPEPPRQPPPPPPPPSEIPDNPFG